MDPKLTLEATKTMTRQCEAVHEQQQLLRGPPKQELSVDSAQHKFTHRNRGPPHRNPRKKGSSESSKCSRCGRESHLRQSCPAKDAVCHKCQRKGHYSSQCFSKTAVKEVTQTDAVYDTSYLTAVTSNDSQTAWHITISVNGCQMPFKLDTGAEMTVVSEKAFASLATTELQSSTKRLCGPDSRPLKVCGELQASPQKFLSEWYTNVYEARGENL